MACRMSFGVLVEICVLTWMYFYRFFLINNLYTEYITFMLVFYVFCFCMYFMFHNVL